MADQLYKKGLNSFLTGGIAWVSTSMGCVLCASEYTVDIVAHDFLNDITAGYRVASGVLANRSASDGVADADDITFSSVSGSNVFKVVIFEWTETEGTSSLIAYIDAATGLPVTPNGGDITLTFSSGSSKIFAL